MIYGLKEKVITIRIKREKEETKCIQEIIKQLNDENENTKSEEEVEEVMRLGPYIEGGIRPIKLRLKTQTATETLSVSFHYFCSSDPRNDKPPYYDMVVFLQGGGFMSDSIKYSSKYVM